VDGTARPRLKRFLTEVQKSVPAQTIWGYGEVNHSDGAKKQLAEIFGGKEAPFATPKPVELLDRVVGIATASDALILDSFAGSGTTAHAVLKANARDNGSRRFILVEGEDYADRLTAERVRRAIKGYAWLGTQRETLLEEKITFTQLKKAEEWLKKVEAIKAREGFAEGDLADQGTVARKRYDRIEVKIDDGVLRVEGVKRVSQMVDGLGGEFAYCTFRLPDPTRIGNGTVGRKSGFIAPSAVCGRQMAEGAGKQPPTFPPYAGYLGTLVLHAIHVSGKHGHNPAGIRKSESGCVFGLGRQHRGSAGAEGLHRQELAGQCDAPVAADGGDRRGPPRLFRDRLAHAGRLQSVFHAGAFRHAARGW